MQIGFCNFHCRHCETTRQNRVRVGWWWKIPYTIANMTERYLMYWNSFAFLSHSLTAWHHPKSKSTLWKRTLKASTIITLSLKNFSIISKFQPTMSRIHYSSCLPIRLRKMLSISKSIFFIASSSSRLETQKLKPWGCFSWWEETPTRRRAKLIFNLDLFIQFSLLIVVFNVFTYLHLSHAALWWKWKTPPWITQSNIKSLRQALNSED